MACRTSSKAISAPSAASQAVEGPSLLQTFQAHVEDMRSLVLCKICIRPLYEPFTLGCGHTYCYSCLTRWFGGHVHRRRRKNCPDCRASVFVQPSPNYLLRDLVHMFISRVELLPEDETTAEHDEAKRMEAQHIDDDRNTPTDGVPGLFKGAFCTGRPIDRPIRDEEDGVSRCPVCAWELEDGECGQCGYADYDDEFTEEEEDHDGETIDSSSIASFPTSAIDHHEYPDYMVPFAVGDRSATGRADRTDLERTQPEAGHSQRAPAQNGRREGRGRPPSAPSYHIGEREPYITGQNDENPGYDGYGTVSEDDHEMVEYLGGPWHRNAAAETLTEDEDMTSAMDEEDTGSTSSFHRAAILARDQGFHPLYESDTTGGLREGDEETLTTGSDSSDESTQSEDDSDMTATNPTTQRLASRPARIVIDSDDDESSDDSSSEEDGESERHPNLTSNEESDSTTDRTTSDEDSTPSPPRTATTRQARLQMQRGRRPVRARGRGRGRGQARGR